MSRRNDTGRQPGRRRVIALAAVAGLGLSVAAVAPVRAAATVNLLETGSSLLYPLFNLWVPVYTKANPHVRITTQSTGSGTGISEAISGVAQIGASDAYLSDALMKMHAGMLNIPLAISSQMVNYNVPGLNGTHPEAQRPGARRHLLRQDPEVERPGDREAEPRREAAGPRHHHRAPHRRQRRYLHLHASSCRSPPRPGRTPPATARP